MSTDKKFEWTDELVKEFVSRDPSIHRCEQDMVEFKASKEVTDTPVQQERIEVLAILASDVFNKVGIRCYTISFNRSLTKGEGEKIKEAIEKKLNNYTDTNQSKGECLFNVELINQRINQLELEKELLILKNRKFKRGDVVKRPNGCRNMTVEEYGATGKVRCVWFNGNKFSGKSFREDNLIIVSQTQPTTPTSNADTKGQVLFTTEDGVEIRENDKYWKVHGLTNISACVGADYTLYKNMYKDESPDSKRFYTREKAEQYILENKPCLSLNDLLDSWITEEERKNEILAHANAFYRNDRKNSPLFKLFKEKAKQKLNH